MHFVHASGKSPKSGELFGGLGQRKQAKRPTIVKLQADPNNKPPQHNRYLTPTFGNDLESPEFNDIPSPLISPTQTHTKQLFQSQDGPEKIFLTEAGVEYDALLSTQRTQGNKQTIESHNNFTSPLTEIGNFLEDDEELTMEDGNKTKLEYQKLQIMDLATTLVAFIGGFLTVLTVSNERESNM